MITNAQSNLIDVKESNWIKPLMPKDMNGLIKLCQILVDSKCVPSWHYKNEQPYASVFACAIRGAELGWPLMTSIQSIQSVNGILSVWGDALLGMIKVKSDYEYLTEEWDEEKKIATCKAKRKGEPEVIRTFSREDAIRANLYKTPTGNDKVTYKYYERRMLQSKARNFAIRDTWPHHLCGFKLMEDMMEVSEIQNIHEDIETSTEVIQDAKLLENSNNSPEESIINKFVGKENINEQNI